MVPNSLLCGASQPSITIDEQPHWKPRTSLGNISQWEAAPVGIDDPAQTRPGRNSKGQRAEEGLARQLSELARAFQAEPGVAAQTLEHIVHGATIRADDLRGEQRWPMVAPRAIGWPGRPSTPTANC
jgi:hypothetical protein